MIIKSYLVEENLENLKNSLVLFYGENIGLLNELRGKLNRKFNKKIIKFVKDAHLNPIVFVYFYKKGQLRIVSCDSRV